MAFAASTSLANGKWIVAGGITGNNSIFGGDECELVESNDDGTLPEMLDTGLFKRLDTLVGFPLIGVFPSEIKSILDYWV